MYETDVEGGDFAGRDETDAERTDNKPGTCFSDVGGKPTYKQNKQYVEEVVIGTKSGATFPVRIGDKLFNAFVNTGATINCQNKECYNAVKTGGLRSLFGWLLAMS